MTTKTKDYIKLYREDYNRVHKRNNTKDARRTPSEIEQSKAAKHKFYSEKWQKLLHEAETQAQKKYCKIILGLNDKYNSTNL